MVSSTHSHEAVVFGSPWATLGVVGSENWGTTGQPEDEWSERGYGIIPHLPAYVLHFGPCFSVCKISIVGAGGLLLEVKSPWLSLAAWSLLPLPTMPVFLLTL